MAQRSNASSSNPFVVTAIGLLCFLSGAQVTWWEGVPFEPWLRHAFIGIGAIATTAGSNFLDDSTDVWVELEKVGKSGIVAHDPARADDGLVLITAGEAAYLIDKTGAVLHSWSAPYQHLPTADGRSEPRRPDRIHWQRAQVMPDGDLLTIVNLTANAPDGLAVLRLDHASRVKWVRYGSFHHDFDIDEDGNIYVLDQQIRQEPPEGLAGFIGPLVDEGITILSPDGAILRRVSIVDAIARSSYARGINERVAINKRHWGDYLHSNNVDFITPQIAQRFPMLAAGQVLISLREPSVIAALDLAEEKLTWAAVGSWKRQHDPDLLANGRILMFDNQGNWQADSTSRVIEYDPASEAIAWQYPPPGQGGLWSRFRADQQQLANGNILINEFQGRRLIEVTRGGDIVWDYRCPFSNPGDAAMVCMTMSARPYAHGELNFLEYRSTVAGAGPGLGSELKGGVE